MSEVHSRSDNLKLALDYKDWEMIATVLRTITKGLKFKGLRGAAKETDRLSLYVDDVLAAQRSEGHV